MIEPLRLPINSDAGHTVHLNAWRLHGDGTGPRAHLQAGVHADEIAGMLVLHRLLPVLQQAQAEGRLRGTVTLVPQANPLGIGQFRQGRVLGRFHDASGQNFNRHFDSSVQLKRTPGNFAHWQQTLAALAADAQLVLDLHTDDEALPYLYVHRQFWPHAQDLAAAMQAEVAILWEGDSDGAFEGVPISQWGQAGLGAERLSATLELRGQGDVSEALAQQDAAGLYRFLCARGVVSDGVALPAWQGIAVDISHMEAVFAPAAGVLVFDRGLGDWLEQGEIFARIVACPGDPASEYELRAVQAGRLLTRYRDRLIPQGAVVAKFTGSTASASWSGGVLDP